MLFVRGSIPSLFHHDICMFADIRFFLLFDFDFLTVDTIQKTGFGCVITFDVFFSLVCSFCLIVWRSRDLVGGFNPFNLNSYVNCVKLIDDKQIESSAQ